MIHNVFVLGNEIPFDYVLKSILEDMLDIKIILSYERNEIIQQIFDCNPKFIIFTSWRQEDLIPLIKSDEVTKNYPIMLISAVHDHKYMSQLNVDSFLCKPMDVTFLVNESNRLLDFPSKKA